MSEVETGQSAQSSAFAVLDEPALRSEARRVRKQVLVATDAVQIRLTVRLYTSDTTPAQPSHCSDDGAKKLGNWPHCESKILLLLLLLLHPFNGLFSTTTWVSRYQKGKPFWILLEQEMMGVAVASAGPYADYLHSLQTDKHASTSPLSFYRPDTLAAESCRPTNSIKSTPYIFHQVV